MKKLGLQFSQMSTPSWFIKDPQFAWGFWSHRYHLYSGTQPHQGFQIMKRWADSKHGNYFIFTSNVDGHWQKAGFPEEKVIECHGTVHYLQCNNSMSCHKEIWPTSHVKIPPIDDNFRATGELPKCTKCGEVARPNVLMFGDSGWVDTRFNVQDRRYDQWANSNQQQSLKIVIIEIGAGRDVPTVRMESQHWASILKDSTLIRINPRDYSVPEGHIPVPLGGLDALVKLNAELEKIAHPKMAISSHRQ